MQEAAVENQLFLVTQGGGKFRIDCRYGFLQECFSNLRSPLIVAQKLFAPVRQLCQQGANIGARKLAKIGISETVV